VSIDKNVVEATLRKFIPGEIDYDTHKNLESDEETGEDHYPALAAVFVYMFDKAQREGTK